MDRSTGASADLGVPMAGLEVLPWHLSLTPARLDDLYVRRLVPRARGIFAPRCRFTRSVRSDFCTTIFGCSVREVVIHGAGRNVATTPCGSSPVRAGSREQGPAGRESGRRAVATVVFAQAHTYNLSHRRLLGILCIYRCPMYVAWEGAG